jgi:hypothetical protein
MRYRLTWNLLSVPQLRFALSSAAAWNENDGCFSYPVFYNNIVDFFEDTPGPTAQAHTQSLLSWWTRYICPILLFCNWNTMAEKYLAITVSPRRPSHGQTLQFLSLPCSVLLVNVFGYRPCSRTIVASWAVSTTIRHSAVAMLMCIITIMDIAIACSVDWIDVYCYCVHRLNRCILNHLMSNTTC